MNVKQESKVIQKITNEIFIHPHFKVLFEVYSLLYTQMKASTIQGKINLLNSTNEISLELNIIDNSNIAYCFKNWEILILKNFAKINKQKIKIVNNKNVNLYDLIENEFDKILIEDAYEKIIGIEHIVNTYNKTLKDKIKLTEKIVKSKTKLSQQKLKKKSIDENYQVLRLKDIVK